MIPTPVRPFLAFSLTLAAALLWTSAGPDARAQSGDGQTIFWDGGNPASPDAEGGSGIWNTSNQNWKTAPSGGSATAYSGSGSAVGGDNVVFGGSAGTVTVNNNLTGGAGSGFMQFDTAGYVFQLNERVVARSGLRTTVTPGTAANPVNLFTIQGTTANTNHILNLRGNNPAANPPNLPGIGHAFTIDSGTVRLFYDSTTDLPAGDGTTAILNGGRMIFTAPGTTIADTGLGEIRLNGDAELRVERDSGGTNTTVTHAGAVTVGDGSTTSFTLGGGVNGLRLDGATTLEGDATFAFNHNNGNPGTRLGGGSGYVDTADGHLLTLTRTAGFGPPVPGANIFFGEGSGDVGDRIRGTGGLVIADQGPAGEEFTVAIFGDNSYSGGTTIHSGRVVVGRNESFGTGAVNINGGNLRATSAGNRTIANPIQVGGDFSVGLDNVTTVLNFSGPIDLGGAVRTVTLNAADVSPGVPRNYTWSGPITNGGLIKQGNATLTLTSGGNTYSGITRVEAGTLRFAGNGANGFQSNIVLDGGNLAFSSNAGINFARTISGTGNVTIEGGSTFFRFSGNNSFSGSVEIDGRLRVGNANSLGNQANPVTVNSGGFLDLNGHSIAIGSLSGDGTVRNQRSASGPGGNDPTILTVGHNHGDSTFSGTLSDGTGDGNTNFPLGLTKVGDGTLTLAGSNTHTGPTTIEGGTLNVTGSVSASPVVVLADGRLSGTGSLGGPSLSISGGTLAPGDSTLLGLGTLTVDADLTFASTWEVSIDSTDASLLLHNGNFLSSLDGITLAAGQTFSPDFFRPYQIYQGSQQNALDGIFANFNEPALAGFEDADGFGRLNGILFAAYLGSEIDGGGNIVAGNGIVLQAVPEPGRALLLAVAVAACLLRRRRP